MIKNTTNEIISILNTDKLLSRLEDSQLESVASCAVINHYKKNQYLWELGDQGNYCTLINSGFIEITRPNGQEENEVCMGIFGKGDVIGLSAFLHKTKFPGNAIALTDVKIIKLYLGAINNNVNSKIFQKEISNWTTEKLLEHEYILREKIDIITAGTVESRFYEFLKQLLRRFGKIESGYKCEIELTITKSKAAELLGIRSETAIRLINSWQKKNLISWQSNKIILHNLPLIERFIKQHHKDLN